MAIDTSAAIRGQQIVSGKLKAQIVLSVGKTICCSILQEVLRTHENNEVQRLGC